MKTFYLFLTLFLAGISVNSQTKAMVINGNSDWVDTGYDFNASNPGIVFASGYVIRDNTADSFDNYASPSGRAFAVWPGSSFPCQTCNATSLIGKIGTNGAPFLIGERAYINKTGRLYLRINDNPLFDNSGAFVAVLYKYVTQIGSNSLSNSFQQQMLKEFGDQKIENNENIGLDELKADYSLTPNPSSSIVKLKLENITNATKIEDVKIFTRNGIELKSIKFPKNGEKEILIPTSGLKSGVYLVNVRINGEGIGKKLIIQ